MVEVFWVLFGLFFGDVELVFLDVDTLGVGNFDAVGGYDELDFGAFDYTIPFLDMWCEDVVAVAIWYS